MSNLCEHVHISFFIVGWNCWLVKSGFFFHFGYRFRVICSSLERQSNQYFVDWIIQINSSKCIKLIDIHLWLDHTFQHVHYLLTRSPISAPATRFSCYTRLYRLCTVQEIHNSNEHGDNWFSPKCHRCCPNLWLQ